MIQLRSRGLAALVLAFSAAGAQAQTVGSGAVSLGASGASQDFDSLAATGESAVLPSGWYFREAGGTTTATYQADDGSLNQGNVMSYGSAGAGDRGFGALPGNTLGPGGTLVADLGARLTNNSGGTLASLPLSFATEVWLYQGAVGERFAFEYSTDATSLTTGSWTAVPALDAVTPAIGSTGKKDGNLAANRLAVSGTLGGLNVAAGGDLWIRWRVTNQSGNDNGLAIDDVVFGTPVDNPPSVQSSTPAAGAANVAVSSAIALTFSEAVTVDIAGVSLACGGSPVSFGLSGSGVAHTVTPTADLPFGAACQLGIAATAVADTDGTPDNLAAAFVLNFTTVADTLPTLASSVPSDEATDFPANANLQITFSEAVTLGASWFDIFCGTSGDRGVADTVVTGGPTAFTINPAADFAQGETCQLRLNAAGIADQDGTPNAPAGDILVDFTPAAPVLNQPPVVLSTTPIDNATDFPSAGDIVVLFSEAVALQPGAFALSCTASTGIALTHAASGTSFTIDTGTALVASDACTFTIDRTKVQDGEGANPAADTVVDFTVASSSTGAYYSQVNTTSGASQLRCSLHETIKGHTKYPYGWPELEIADEDPNDAGRILDIYRNCSFKKPDNRDSPTGGIAATCGGVGGLLYNREHVWPNSLGFGNSSLAAYTDLHMLHLSDKAFNGHRGNSPYDYCPQNEGCTEDRTITYNGDAGGNGTYPGNSNWYDGNRYEVWHRWRGNMARAIFYMAIRYEGIASENAHDGDIPDLELTDNAGLVVQTSNTAAKAYMGILQTLLEWHEQDPVDERERERNLAVFDFQGNRNPFIDHPEWATRALFESTQPANCVLGGGNTAPVANDDGVYNATEDTLLTVAAAGVLANDTDAQATPLTAALAAQAAHGTVTLATNGGFTYQPAANYCGNDEFTYRASDGQLQSAAVARIAVACVDDLAVAEDDIATVAEDAGATTIAVLANDSVDADTNAIAVTAVSPAQHGTTAFTAANVSYTPAADYCGSDSFTYTVGGGDTAVVDVTVTCVTDAPVVTGTLPDRSFPLGQPIAGFSVAGAFGGPDPATGFQADGLPPGLSIDAAGNVTGTPTANGVYAVAARALNPGGSAQVGFTITIGGPALFADGFED